MELGDSEPTKLSSTMVQSLTEDTMTQFARTRRLETLVVVQTGFIVLMMVTMCATWVTGYHAYKDLSSKAEALYQLEGLMPRVNEFVGMLTHPEQIIAPETAATYLRETASAFFLGSTNGSVAAFIQKLAENDFAGTAAKVKPLSDFLFTTFQAKMETRVCTDNLQCAVEGYYPCPPPSTKRPYCDSPGDVVNCGDCTFGVPANYAAVVSSVVSKITQVKTIGKLSNGQSPAMSDGLLRLNMLIEWVSNQGDVDSWKTASKQCNALVKSVEAVSWADDVTLWDGQTVSWDWSNGIRTVTKQIRTYCDAIGEVSGFLHGSNNTTRITGE